MSDSPLQYVLSKEEWQYYRECEADAMRYRWLRNNLYVEDGCLETAVNIYCHSAPNKADIDAAIDAAMSNAQAQGAGGGFIAGGSPGAEG